MQTFDFSDTYVYAQLLTAGFHNLLNQCANPTAFGRMATMSKEKLNPLLPEVLQECRRWRDMPPSFDSRLWTLRRWLEDPASLLKPPKHPIRTYFSTLQQSHIRSVAQDYKIPDWTQALIDIYRFLATMEVLEWSFCLSGLHYAAMKSVRNSAKFVD